MTRNIILAFVALTLMTAALNAQDEEREIDVYHGLRVTVGQFDHFQFDVGYGAQIDGILGRLHTFVLDAAIEARNFHRDAVYGPKIYVGHIWGIYNTDLDIVSGINLIGYTNFHGGNYPCLRPDIGISLLSLIDFTYGYNFFPKEIPGNPYFNRHVISMVVRLGLMIQLDRNYHT